MVCHVIYLHCVNLLNIADWQESPRCWKNHLVNVHFNMRLFELWYRHIFRLNLFNLSRATIKIFDFQMPTSLEFIMQFYCESLRKAEVLWNPIDTTTFTILLTYGTIFIDYKLYNFCTSTLLSCLNIQLVFFEHTFQTFVTCRHHSWDIRNWFYLEPNIPWK